MRRRSRTRRTLYWTLASLLVTQRPVAPAEIIVGGPCGLVEAVTAANTDRATGGCPAGEGFDVLRLTSDVSLGSVDNDIDGSNATPSIVSEMLVDGNGFRVSFTGNEARLFHIASHGTLSLSDVTVSGGFFYDELASGGGIFNRGGLTLVNTTIERNTASRDGNGLYNLGDLTAVRSLIQENDGATYGEGGGLLNRGVATLVSSTVSGNNARRGAGGVRNEGGTVTILNSTISGDVGAFDTGGVENVSGTLTIVNSTISGNLGNYGAGGVYVQSGEARVIRTTITDNYPGGARAGTGSLTLAASIVAGNPGYIGSENCVGRIVDAGGNFDDDGTCAGAEPIVSGVDFDTTLADNGGVTSTHALLDGSVAIDTDGDCGLALDQRGFVRDESCDGGAYEFAADVPTAPAITVTGVCPGEVVLTISNATSDGEVVVGGAVRPGADVRTSGPCTGTVSDLEDPRVLLRLTADQAGNATATLELSSRACGAPLQVADLSTCAVSPRARVPNPRR